MSEFREVGIIRDPQPNDVVVITVPKNTTLEFADRVSKSRKAELACRVVVVTEGIRVGDDGAAAELAALKARRCDGCAEGADWPSSGLWCLRFALNVEADHACNAWTAKEPTT